MTITVYSWVTLDSCFIEHSGLFPFCPGVGQSSDFSCGAVCPPVYNGGSIVMEGYSVLVSGLCPPALLCSASVNYSEKWVYPSTINKRSVLLKLMYMVSCALKPQWSAYNKLTSLKARGIPSASSLLPRPALQEMSCACFIESLYRWYVRPVPMCFNFVCTTLLMKTIQ